MTHLLLTNDYPPKVGGIQSYLWELWRRLPQDEFTVFTSPHTDAAAFDRAQAHRIVRHSRFWLPPSPAVAKAARREIDTAGASLAVIDPAFPLAAISNNLGVPSAVVIHGAEVSVPARLPAARAVLKQAIRRSALVISASGFAEAEARRIVPTAFPPTVYVPPGVDTERFVPLGVEEREAARRRLGFDPHAPLVVGVSRLVPRKGFDTLIRAASQLSHRHPDLQVVIAGTGRDEARLRSVIGRTGSPARLLGFVDDADLPALYGCADAFVMLCRSRWAGLEQEGFGIVFVEAAAAGCPQIAGESGGSAEAVDHGSTGLVIGDPSNVDDVAAAIDGVLTDDSHRESMRIESRRHAVKHFSYDMLAHRLHDALAEHGGLAARGGR